MKMIFLGNWDNPEYKLYRYPLLNQYTNTFFFNAYTFVGVGNCILDWLNNYYYD
ncbi:hypothetical protein EV294_1021 [Paenibacillus sp. BK033]|nr:hypothetical protein EV294_1021 [Paenibacillus sp. BK033]